MQMPSPPPCRPRGAPRALALPRGAGAVALALALLAGGRVSAYSCVESSWTGVGGRSPAVAGGSDFPVDIQPWALRECQAAPGTCTLVGEGEEVDAEVVASPCTSEEYTTTYQVVRLVPERLLTPGMTYETSCSFGLHFGYIYEDPRPFQIRGSSTPARRPIEVLGVDVDRRFSDGCCSDDVFLEVAIAFEGDAAGFFEEGGSVEVASDEGTYVIASSVGPWALPETRGDLVVTPVSASGERGEPVTIDRRDVGGDVAYVPCSIGPGSKTMALWILVPVVLARVGARRRRAAGGAA